MHVVKLSVQSIFHVVVTLSIRNLKYFGIIISKTVRRFVSVDTQLIPYYLYRLFLAALSFESLQCPILNNHSIQNELQIHLKNDYDVTFTDASNTRLYIQFKGCL